MVEESNELGAFRVSKQVNCETADFLQLCMLLRNKAEWRLNGPVPTLDGNRVTCMLEIVYRYSSFHSQALLHLATLAFSTSSLEHSVVACSADS